MAAAVEAVCAHLAFRQTDCFYLCLFRVEPQSCEVEATAFFLHQTLVFGRVGGGIFVEVLASVALKFLDDAPCDQLHVALRRRESVIRTSVV